MIFCLGENSLFPESDFVHTTEGKVFQPPIHHIQQEHWATTGLYVDPAALDGVVSYDRVHGIIEIRIIPTPVPSTPGTLGEEEGK
jgi:hypothetical protein